LIHLPDLGKLKRKRRVGRGHHTCHDLYFLRGVKTYVERQSVKKRERDGKKGRSELPTLWGE